MVMVGSLRLHTAGQQEQEQRCSCQQRGGGAYIQAHLTCSALGGLVAAGSVQRLMRMHAMCGYFSIQG
jgi:hypothetical protein